MMVMLYSLIVSIFLNVGLITYIASRGAPDRLIARHDWQAEQQSMREARRA